MDQPAPEPVRVNRIRLLPMGKLASELPARLRLALERVLEIDCELGDFVPRPLRAFDEARNQYDASRVLERVSELRQASELPPSTALLALIDSDMHLPPYNFTFGHWDRPERVAVLSLTRLQPACYGEEDSPEKLFARASVEALYLIGALLGLPACEDPTCPMFAANGVHHVDAKQPQFCADCSRLLGLRQR